MKVIKEQLPLTFFESDQLRIKHSRRFQLSHYSHHPYPHPWERPGPHPDLWNPELELPTSVRSGFTHFPSKSVLGFSFALGTLRSVGCSTLLSDLVLLSGGLYLPCHQLLSHPHATAALSKMDSVSTSRINVKGFTVCYQNHWVFCCCRITDCYGFPAIWHLTVQIDLPCLTNSTCDCCQFLGLLFSLQTAGCSKRSTYTDFFMGTVSPG